VKFIRPVVKSIQYYTAVKLGLPFKE
jgi:hypothetical protein